MIHFHDRDGTTCTCGVLSCVACRRVLRPVSGARIPRCTDCGGLDELLPLDVIKAHFLYREDS